MIEVAALAILFVLFLGIRAWDKRASRHNPARSQMLEYIGLGQWRDFYAPFYNPGVSEQERIYRAVELTEQRRNGRWEGQTITIDWHPGLDEDVDIAARWLKAHGAAYGVLVRKIKG